MLVATRGIPHAEGPEQRPETIPLGGHAQKLLVYGTPDQYPVVVSSGDGGWIHLGPHVAEVLARHGYYVLGFDVKAYLESFTSDRATLLTHEEPRDYGTIAQMAMRRTGRKPILVGISEGAGLSVLAATDPATQEVVAGVVGLGLPDLNELAWRWKDSLIYLTHRVPNEPTFSAAEIVPRVAPLPIAAIHSTHDEFVPLSQIQTIMARASTPKRLWIVKAADHRFSDNLAAFDATLLESIAWVRENGPR